MTLHLTMALAVDWTGFMGTCFPELLQLVDLCRFGAACAAARAALHEEHPWRRCASAQIPFLVVSPGLFLTETRRELLSCCSAVGFAIVGNGVSIDLNTIDEVKSLDKSMRNSRKTAQTHLHRGGSAAITLIGRFHLLPMNKQENLSIAGSGSRSSEHVGFDAVGDSKGTDGNIFELGSKDPLCPPRALQVRLGLRGQSLLVSARCLVNRFANRRTKNGTRTLDATRTRRTSVRNGWRSCPDQPEDLTFDIHSLSNSLALLYRGLGLRADGKANVAECGMWSWKRSSEPAQRHASALYVLTVRHGIPESTDFSIAPMLNLDMVRSREVVTPSE